MDKKGAVELSMTTIIIIVIGITILSLGLVWIRSVFTDVGSLTEGAFERGEGEIAEIFGGTDEIVGLSPSQIGLEQGDSETASLIINNLGQSDGLIVQASVAPIGMSGADTSKLVCVFQDTFEGESASYTLNSGNGVEIGVIVEDQGSSLGNYGCKIDISGLEEGQQTKTLIVQIE
ncbi:hypothetical protein HOC80_03210 [archaeon]|jgi:hypothetical protein|nr:hypothetical protein [archaeon]MBT4417087.1 hypothetical protein [archaeon]